MSLRYRLFLWVSGLFLVVAVSSLFMESYVTRHQLKIAQANLREKLLTMSEERRKDLENFLAAAVTESQVSIDALLNNLSIFTPQMLRFGPTDQNLANGTWQPASELLMDFRWIDYLLSSNEGKVSAEIIPDERALHSSYRVPIEQGLAWIYLNPGSDPYIGIKIPFKYFEMGMQVENDQVVRNEVGFEPFVYLLFDMKKIEAALKGQLKPLLNAANAPAVASIPVAWSEGFALQVADFIGFFNRMSAMTAQNQLASPNVEASLVQQKLSESLGGVANMIPGGNLLSTTSTEKYMHERLEATSLRFLQINMIWMLIAMQQTGIFGKDIFQFPMPEGITLFSNHEDVGMGVETNQVLFSKALFDDSNYYSENAPPNANSMLGTSLAVIADAQPNHVYLGNTAQFDVGKNKGYLTVATDADGILQKLVLALHQSAFLVNDGKVRSAFTSAGEKVYSAQMEAEDQHLPLDKMLQEKYGLVDWKGSRYFFLHMKPFSSIDLHFFLLNPEEVEFALLHDLDQGSEEVVHKILLNLHITGLVALVIAIIVLHNISRNITRPIIQLADATKDVVEGRYDQIQLHLPPLKHQDEIAVLCHSFDEMVTGLIEKEKVKGVLNKVVSQEIAQEILKGNVHLGGEEKQVTVLFADIRGFTQMTQHMEPSAVIELLNTCMTKVSLPIDQHHGVIDKYVGDEAMALFGAPVAMEDNALQAVYAALEIMDVLKKWNEERTQKNEPPIEMGIGVHTGKMLAGNMGAENRLNYTVLGSNVNLASRLCDVANKMEILITKDTLDALNVKDHIVYTSLTPMQFKGFDVNIEIFKVTGKKNTPSDSSSPKS